ADEVDPYSSRGPSACAGSVAPRLAAPGVGIRTSDLYGGYLDATGTSLAAPHAAGALALLLSAAPGTTADRQQAALEAGAVDLGPPGGDPDYGSGRLDALASYQWLATTPDFTVAASPSSVTTSAGGSASYTVSVSALNGFSGDVSLSLGGLPAAVGSATFTPATVAGAGSSQLRITTSRTAPTGSYPLTVSGTSGSTTHTVSATLVVTAPRDFSLTVSPSSVTVYRRQVASYTVSVSP